MNLDFTIADFPGIGGQELLLMFMLALLLFGAKKLPELARGLGQKVPELQKAKVKNRFRN